MANLNEWGNNNRIIIIFFVSRQINLYSEGLISRSLWYILRHDHISFWVRAMKQQPSAVSILVEAWSWVKRMRRVKEELLKFHAFTGWSKQNEQKDLRKIQLIAFYCHAQGYKWLLNIGVSCSMEVQNLLGLTCVVEEMSLYCQKTTINHYTNFGDTWGLLTVKFWDFYNWLPLT